jgi:hypothetical protein
VHNLARRNSLEVGSTREKKGGEERRYARNSAWQFGTGTGIPAASARVSQTEKQSDLTALTSRDRAPCKARWVWAGEVIIASVTCSLQFAKASASTLSQQEKNNSADVQRGLLSRYRLAGAHSQVASAASCLCLSPGYHGANMVHPLAWPTHPLEYPASPQRAGRWSPWTPEKKQMNSPFYYSLTRRSRVQVLPTRARNNDTWDRRCIVNNIR